MSSSPPRTARVWHPKWSLTGNNKAYLAQIILLHFLLFFDNKLLFPTELIIFCFPCVQHDHNMLNCAVKVLVCDVFF